MAPSGLRADVGIGRQDLGLRVGLALSSSRPNVRSQELRQLQQLARSRAAEPGAIPQADRVSGRIFASLAGDGAAIVRSDHSSVRTVRACSA